MQHLDVDRANSIFSFERIFCYNLRNQCDSSGYLVNKTPKSIQRLSRRSSTCCTYCADLGLHWLTCLLQYQHISSIYSETYSFQPAALVFSLPRALSIWALGLIAAQSIYLMSSLVHTSVAIGCATVALLLMLMTAQVISEDDKWPTSARAYNRAINIFETFKCALLRHEN